MIKANNIGNFIFRQIQPNEAHHSVSFGPFEKGMSVNPKELYKELLQSDPELIAAVEKMEESIKNPSYQDYENILKDYESKMELKSPENDIEIE